MSLFGERVSQPYFFLEVEEALDKLRNGQWRELERFDRSSWKSCVKALWQFAEQDGILELERTVYQVLSHKGNGAVSVESLLIRLLDQKTVCGFAYLRRALAHLERLGVVERQAGQYSVKFGVLEQ